MSVHDLSAEDPFGAIADEFVEAFRQGQRPSVGEFARRYRSGYYRDSRRSSSCRDELPACMPSAAFRSPAG
jgi:hypothetical protein